jgi:hypothetical protein
MNTALEYSTRVVQEGGRRCKKSTLNDLVHLTPRKNTFNEPAIRNESNGGKSARKPYHPYGFKNPYPTKQSFIEENSSLFMNSVLYKDKNEGRNIKTDKSQDYSQEPQRNYYYTFMNSILAFVFVTVCFRQDNFVTAKSK